MEIAEKYKFRTNYINPAHTIESGQIHLERKTTEKNNNKSCCLLKTYLLCILKFNTDKKKQPCDWVTCKNFSHAYTMHFICARLNFECDAKNLNYPEWICYCIDPNCLVIWKVNGINIDIIESVRFQLKFKTWLAQTKAVAFRKCFGKEDTNSFKANGHT